MLFPRILIIVLAVAIVGCSAPDNTEMVQDETTLEEQNEAIIYQVLTLIDERNLDAAFELYALDYIYHGPGGQELRGRDSIRGLWEVFLAGFPDLHSTVEDMVSEGDKVALRWRIEGTQSPRSFALQTGNSSRPGTSTIAWA